jgi:hypothetical protein
MAGGAIAAFVVMAALCVPLDGYDGWALSLLAMKEDTVYAAGYSDAAFRRVDIGMTEREVAALLQEPLEIYTAKLGAELMPGWAYTRSAADASYRVRCILFRDGRVAKVLHEFYLD